MQQPTTTASWQNLIELVKQIGPQHMRDMFVQDPNRVNRFHLKACGLALDYSKNRINDEVMQALFALARETGVEQQRDAMFNGELINTTEGRAVLHTALRNRSDRAIFVDNENVMPSVRATLDKMRTFTQRIHEGQHLGFTGKPITDVVSLGIGGSFLGPKIMTEALKPYQQSQVKVHFVANVDGCHIQDVLATVNPSQTLIVMSSKSFTTQETLQNMRSAKRWFLANGGSEEHVAKHFIAISSNVRAAVEFGIDADNIFPMWDWVGGRYSLWSAIGLPIALALGFEHFSSLLDGAFDMDEHFRCAPLEQNLPTILALLGVWYRNFFAAQSHVLLPYYHYLRGLPAYVQQLDMESNGKQVAQDGAPLDYDTGPIIWGSEGTNGQHSFHQLIHQSATLIPADFLLPLTVPQQDLTHHAMLASNCFGQSQALMQGKTFDECYQDLPASLPEEERRRLAQHKTMPGNRPSNTITFTQLDPYTLGALIALYEHKVFVQGAIWQLNSFDQWGVELGKVLGNQVLEAIFAEQQSTAMDASTQSLVAQFKRANALK